MAPPATATLSSPGGCVVTRYGFLAAAGGAPLHRARTMMVQVAPARLQVHRGGRLLLVAGAAAAPGPEEGGDDDLPSSEDMRSAFRLEMETFKASHRPLTLIGIDEDMTVDVAYVTAMDCTAMLEFLLSKETIRPDLHGDLVLAGKAFLTMELQAEQGYLRAADVANGIEGLRLMGSVFFQGMPLPNYTVPVVPMSADDVEEKSLFKGLVNIFVELRLALYVEAKSKHSYGAPEAYDGLLSADCQRALEDFRKEMDVFKASFRPEAQIMNGPSSLYNLAQAWGAAEMSYRMLEFVLAETYVHRDTRIPEELVDAGQAFIVIMMQTQRYYVVADALLRGIQGLKVIGKKFFGVNHLGQNPLLAAALDVGRDEFFALLLKNFVDSSNEACDQAIQRYGFRRTRGEADE